MACLIVVPAIAMFSHHVPPGARAAVAAVVQRMAGVVAPAPAPPPAAAATPDVSVPHAVTGAVDQAPAAIAAVPPPAVPPADADSLTQLRSLGAVAIDCRQLDGRGVHLASCRIPVDPTGQLERLFQATGPDAATAAQHLLRDVAAWRRGTDQARRGPIRF